MADFPPSAPPMDPLTALALILATHLPVAAIAWRLLTSSTDH